MSEPRTEIWTQFHDLGHPTTFLAPYGGAMLRWWLEFFSSLPEGGTLSALDIGTGNLPIPKIMLGMPGRRFDIRAIDTADIAPAQIPRVANLKFHRRSIEDTGFDDECFDVVTGCFALEYARLGLALPELNRIMKPGARAAFVIHHPDSVSVQSAAAAMREDVPLIFRSGVFEAMRAWLADAGQDQRTAAEQRLAALDQPQHRRYWRVEALLKQARKCLERPDPGAWLRWEEGFVLDQKRREALLAAVVMDGQKFCTVLEACGFRVDPLDTVVERGPGSTPDQPGEVLGWGVRLTRDARVA